MELGKKIRQLRYKAGLTQEQLADKLGIGPQSISKWENAASMPDITTLPLLAETFGISIDDLFDLSSEQHLNRIEKRKHGCSPRCRRHKSAHLTCCVHSFQCLSREIHASYWLYSSSAGNPSGLGMCSIRKFSRASLLWYTSFSSAYKVLPGHLPWFISLSRTRQRVFGRSHNIPWRFSVPSSCPRSGNVHPG